MDAQTKAAGDAAPGPDIAVIGRLFDARTVAYVQKKHEGGTSGKKGTRYEDFFATARIAEILAAHVQDHGPLPTVEEQALGFVDDLVVAETATTKYFQCKNSATVSWSSGDHPIEVDFENQIILARELGKPDPKVELVVSDSARAEKLGGEIPKAIETSTTVRHFPYAERVNQLVFSNESLRETLSKLTRMEAPEIDDLEAAFSALLLCWVKVSGKCTLEELVKSAREQSPQLLRVLPINEESQGLSEDFVNALAAIPGFSYSVKRGFFSWAAEGFLETLRCDCKSEAFERFMRRVIQAKPRHFDDFWEQLP